MGDRLAVGVVDVERLLKLADGPGGGEAADGHRSHARVIAGLSGFFTPVVQERKSLKPVPRFLLADRG